MSTELQELFQNNRHWAKVFQAGDAEVMLQRTVYAARSRTILTRADITGRHRLTEIGEAGKPARSALLNPLASTWQLPGGDKL